MPEGVLLECSDCGQLISQCSETKYFSSMQEFNVSAGTAPNQQSMNRAKKLHTDRLSLIQKKLGKAARDIKLMDVGCSSGTFLNTAKQLNFQTYGVEPSAKAAATAMQHGHNVVVGELNPEQYVAHSFDAITLFEVIEHLPNPLQLLQAMRRILKLNGIIMLSTGNAQSLTVKYLQERWDYFSIDAHGGHISFYNPFSMKRLAAKAKLQVDAIITKNTRFAYKETCAKFTYRLLKILTELLNPIIKTFGQGHDMIVIMRLHDSALCIRQKSSLVP